MEYVRLHLNDFTDPDQPDFTPSPRIANSTADWQNHVLGAVVAISIPMDEGSVILSGYSSTSWDFSTIHEPFFYNGSQPVSGTREFRCIPSGAGATFYIRGADRANCSPMELLGKISGGTTSPAKVFQFTAGDKLWSSLERSIADFVNSHGGSATVKPPVVNRPNWEEVKKALDGNTP